MAFISHMPASQSCKITVLQGDKRKVRVVELSVDAYGSLTSSYFLAISQARVND